MAKWILPKKRNFANVEVLYDRWHTMLTDIRNLVKEYETMEKQALAEQEEITT